MHHSDKEENMTIRPFEVNGWTIAPHGDEEYVVSRVQNFRESTLEGAVRLAQDASLQTLASGDPEDIDHQLRSMLPDADRLTFYQWVGRIVLREAFAELHDNVGADPSPPENRSYSQDTVFDLIEVINPDKSDYDDFPSKLPEHNQP